MRIEKNVLVRHVLTEDYREKLLKKIASEKERLNTENEQLQFQYQKQLKESNSRNKSAIESRFTSELNKRRQRIESLNFRESKVKTLPTGSLVTGETVKRFTDVQVGDRWATHRLEDEIIIEDDIVREIRSKGEDGDDSVQH
ncbi:YlqD family protein [Natribacillus halophilus]|uniref:YlqD protein n=1 Tax=Natribacillus halophilus TaxID=549003 RepID=A0A1G8MJ52_9BACI|nr:YlqD family protein [Natribacillus halophilus]SDI67956.1 YlqD protein [Natribacillus halophilus]